MESGPVLGEQKQTRPRHLAFIYLDERYENGDLNTHDTELVQHKQT